MGMGDLGVGCCNCGGSTIVHTPGNCCGAGGMPAVITITPQSGSVSFWVPAVCTYSTSGPPGYPDACRTASGLTPNCSSSWWSPLINGGTFYYLECSGSSTNPGLKLGVVNYFGAGTFSQFQAGEYAWNDFLGNGSFKGGTVTCSPYAAVGLLQTTPDYGDAKLNASG